MNLIFGRDAEVAHWVAERIPYLAVRIPYFQKGMMLGPCAAIGVANEFGEPLAGVIYHAHDPFVRGMEVSCASTGARWANREVFRALLRYPFEQCNIRRLGAATPKRSTSPRRFLEGLGFRREGSLRYAFGDDSAILYGLLAEEWAAGRFCQPRGALRDVQEEPYAAACA